MSEFKGFTAGTDDSVPVPEAFFTELLPVIDDLEELRVTLYAFWNFSGQVRDPRYLRFSEILKDDLLMAGFGETADSREKNLAEALKRACGRGTLLEAQLENDNLLLHQLRARTSGHGRSCLAARGARMKNSR